MKYFLFILAVSSAIFLLFPNLDLIISRYFFELNDGRFFFKDKGFFGIVYYGVYAITGLVITVLSLVLGWSFFNKRPPIILHKRAIVFLLITLMLAPGFAVNGVLKEFSGRARPYYITEFGGDKQFTPALRIGNQCETNCSFVSGHAAAGFMVMALAFVYPTKRRRWIVAGITSGVLVGIARIAQGGHFASDIIFAGLTVYMVCYIVDILLKRMAPFSDTQPPTPHNSVRISG